MICPCRGCADRRELCHAECERYGAWKAYREAGRKKKRDVKEADSTLIESNIQRREAYRAHSCNRLKSLK